MMAAYTSSACIVAAVAILLTQTVTGCVYKYGEDPMHPFSKPGSVHFTYEFAGLDWNGTCTDGHQQSPINIPHTLDFPHVSDADHTIPDFGVVKSNGSNVKIFNNLHVVQVEWATGALQSLNATVAVPDLKTSMLTDTLGTSDKSQRAPITPLQFHFHAHSEHAVGGSFYPLEMHIVSHATVEDLPACTGKLGCLTVVGVMWALDDDDNDNPLLTQIFDLMPSTVDTTGFLPKDATLDLNSFLPSNKSYVTYSGSLTTPPCSEQVLWHVMLTPMTMSSKQLKQFLNATGDIACSHKGEATERPVNGSKPANAVTTTTNSTGSVDMLLESGEVCHKLGAGQNYRIVQPRYDRNILKYVDTSSGSSQKAAAANSTSTSSFASDVPCCSIWLSLVSLLLAVLIMQH